MYVIYKYLVQDLKILMQIQDSEKGYKSDITIRNAIPIAISLHDYLA